MIITVFIVKTCYASALPIPARIQAALFSKVFQYEHSLKSKESVRILIVYEERDYKVKDELVTAFLRAGFDVEYSNAKDITKYISGFDVVYFMNGTYDLTHLCKENNVLSISSNPKIVQSGDISIGIGLVNDLPRIFINLTGIELEGFKVSSQLLKIAVVYK